MTNQQRGASRQSHDPDPGSHVSAPNRLTWPFKRLFWTLEKYLLWPIADSFKWVKERLSYRSPFAYIGATLAFAITAGAVATAVYFHNESKSATQTPVVAQVPQGVEAGSVAIPTTPLENPVTPPTDSGDPNTLKGVAPSFETSAGSGGGTNSPTGNKVDKADPTLVKPAKAPESGPLMTAHSFATTFVDYEVGKKGAAKQFKKTATKSLAKALAVDPPKLPANGTVPKATVMNVVMGPKVDGKLGVSVALMRLGTASELRLALGQIGKGNKKQWLVTEVRG